MSIHFELINLKVFQDIFKQAFVAKNEEEEGGIKAKLKMHNLLTLK